MWQVTDAESVLFVPKAERHARSLGQYRVYRLNAHDDCSTKLIEWGARVARANTRPHQTI